MIFKYDFTSIIWLQNQTDEHTGWSSCNVFGSWVASGRLCILSAPGCCRSRVSAATKYIHATRCRKTSAGLCWLYINKLLSRSGVSVGRWPLLARLASPALGKAAAELAYWSWLVSGRFRAFGRSWLQSLQESHRLLKFGQLPRLPLGPFCSLQSLQRHAAALPRPCAGVSLHRQASLDSSLQPLCGGGSLSSLITCTSIASFSLPQLLLHRTAVGVRYVPAICHRLMPAWFAVVVSVEKQLQACFSGTKQQLHSIFTPSVQFIHISILTYFSV